MSTLKVNTIRHTGASSDAVTLATDGTCTAKITNNLSNRNLIINGAMQIAQRGTSTSTNNTFAADRFCYTISGYDEAPTLTQHALTSSDTGPWAEGFRYSSHIQNGNQTSGAGNQDYAQLHYVPEAQDIANSGWNYTSASSYITLSFWVKSSVAQSFPFSFGSNDGTQKTYRMTTGSLSADTWTKVTKTIPGHADLTFNNDNGVAGYLWFWPFIGTEWTTSGASENSWTTFSTSTYAADMTTTWWTTNDATFEMTGVQLEVGDVATDFEHRSYDQERDRCLRYFERWQATANGEVATAGYAESSSISAAHTYVYQKRKRAIPSISLSANNTWHCQQTNTTQSPDSMTISVIGEQTCAISAVWSSVNFVDGGAVMLRAGNVPANTHLDVSAEL